MIATGPIRRIVVTGAGGFIGRTLVAELLAQGHLVLAHTRAGGAGGHPNLTVQCGDLRAGLDIPAATDLVIHAAAAGQSGADTAACLNGTIDLTRPVLAAAIAAEVPRLLLLSSMATIGVGDGAVVTESSVMVDPQPYGMAKRLCEQLCADRADRLHTLSLRLPNVLGAGCHGHFIAGLWARLRRHQPVTAFNEDGLFNSVVEVGQLCRFIARLAAAGWDRSDTLCLGSCAPLTIGACALRLARACGSRSAVSWRSAPRPPYLIDSRHAENDYGYRPQAVGDVLDDYARQELAMAPAPH